MLVTDGARPPESLRHAYLAALRQPQELYLAALRQPQELYLAALRQPQELYLAALRQPQELYLESLVQAGGTPLLHDDADRDRTVGYAVIGDNAIVEFYLEHDYLAALPAAFETVLDHTMVARALCKSFDTLALTAMSSLPARVTTTGHLFRLVRDTSASLDHEVLTRLGTPIDLDAVWSIQDGFFDDHDEVLRYITDRSMFLYQGIGGELLGCGILTRVIPGDTAVDVGMVVAPAHRGRGLGSYIVADLKDRCLRAHDRPIAGCDAANRASRHALENAGFATAHSLLEFTYLTERPGVGRP